MSKCNKVLTIDPHTRSLTVVHLGSPRGTRDVDGRVEIGVADVELPRVDADYRTWRSGCQHFNPNLYVPDGWDRSGLTILAVEVDDFVGIGPVLYDVVVEFVPPCCGC